MYFSAVSRAVRESTYPFLAVISLRDNRMTIVWRIEGKKNTHIFIYIKQPHTRQEPTILRISLTKRLWPGKVVWDCISSSELPACQRFQNRVLSVMERARFRDPWPKNWLSVVNFVGCDRCVMVYEFVNKQCSRSLWNIFYIKL